MDGKREGLKSWRRLKELVEERKELLNCTAYHLFIATALNLVISSSIFRRNSRLLFIQNPCFTVKGDVRLGR
jgi:hypothetical protein